MSTRKEKASRRRAEREQPFKPTIEQERATVNITPEFNKPEELPELRYKPLQKIEAVTPFVQTDGKPNSIISTEAPVTPVVGKAETVDTGAPKSIVKQATFSDMLAPLRASAIKDKTDAQKMQQYYAMSDVLSALGKMGGAAVGGAIGGSALDSAPATEPYKESRGYLEAFDRVKQADDRLRKLDEQEFQLAYNKKQRDEERAYQAEQSRINREFQAKESMLTREWNKAIADGNREEQYRIEKELTILRHENDMALQRLRNQGDLDEKKAGLATSQWQASVYNTTPIRFKDGTTAMIPDNYYESIKHSLIGEVIGGVTVDKNNVDRIIRNNPALINEFLEAWGLVTPTNYREPSAVVKKTPYSGPSSRIDYAENQGPSSYNEIREEVEMSDEEKKNKWRNRNNN